MEKTNNNNNNAGSSCSNNIVTARTGKKGPRKKGVDTVAKKFLGNFDPERSEREKRKLRRRLCQTNKKNTYDEQGLFLPTLQDVCDCLNLDCPGCHFPCPKCSSTKCAHECRNNRKWAYEAIHYEGSETVIKNKLQT